jgi:hypothetical protein
MAKAKKGDFLSCEACGLVLVVDEACGCDAAEVICCDKPMAGGKQAANRVKKLSAAKKPAAKKAVPAKTKAATKKAAPAAKAAAKKPAKAAAKAKPAVKKPVKAKK